MATTRRVFLLTTAALAAVEGVIGRAGPALGQAQAPLWSLFEQPPPEAAPRVWWHWMNQNITKEGITADLEWFKRIGVGGFVNFDGAVSTPVVVERPLPYLSDGWKDAFRHAMTLADRLGLEATVAASPGWSETGGPWVEPKDAMKKLVWTETWVAGGKEIELTLPRPSDVAGPFQDLPATPRTAKPLPRFYQDVRVFAFPVGPQARGPGEAPPAVSASGGAPIDGAKLANAALTDVVLLPRPTPEAPTWVQFDYGAPVTVTAVTVAVGGAFSGWGDAIESGMLARLYVEGGADWRPLGESLCNGGQRTFVVPATRGRRFKVEFLPPTVAPTPSLLAPPPPREPPPLAIGALVLRTTPTVHQFENKAGFGQTANFYKVDTPREPALAAVDPAKVFDLTGRMTPAGVLKWQAPPGRWIVVRLGAGLTGHENGPASDAGTGLEVDKLDGDRVRAYLRTYIGLLKDAAGPDLVGARGLTGVLCDSYEAGYQNWTDKLLAEFRARRGYDASSYLPALVGYAVKDAKASDAFLWDWRRTLAELLADQHYKVVAEETHASGLRQTYAEAEEDRRGWFGDDMEMRQYADVPMGASGGAFPPGEAPYETYRVDCKGAASVAHIYGKRFACAESFTFTPQGYTPKQLKPLADMMFAQGVNRLMIHTSAHQPVEGVGPGVTLGGIGSFFTRHETWAEQAKPWTTYLARCCALLSTGRPVADVAYFYGQEGPITGQWGRALKMSDAPSGYDYDFVNGAVILNELEVRGGDLVTRHGGRYRLLQMGGQSNRITLAVLRKLAAFVEAGASVLGGKPEGSPSLADDPAAFAALAARLWGDGNQRVRRVGAGRVFTQVTAGEALLEMGVAPDWQYAQQQVDPLAWIHRSTDEGEIYFVANRRAARTVLPVSLRATGAIELWDPVSGERRPVSYANSNGRAAFTLDLAAADSAFVVVAKAGPAAATAPAAPERIVSTLTGGWDVAFQPDHGAPATLALPALMSLSAHDVPGVRYYSGTATYRARLDLAAGMIEGAGRLWLDLGEVGDLASVKVNGVEVGTVWRKPYRVDVSRAVRTGANEIEIAVTNSWLNRLIGDAQPGAQRVAFFPGGARGPAAQDPLAPSGLEGPVRLVRA